MVAWVAQSLQPFIDLTRQQQAVGDLRPVALSNANFRPTGNASITALAPRALVQYTQVANIA